MKQISVSQMQNWLYYVMETERKLLVLSRIITELNTEISRCSTPQMVAPPKKIKIFNISQIITGTILGTLLGMIIAGIIILITSITSGYNELVMKMGCIFIPFFAILGFLFPIISNKADKNAMQKDYEFKLKQTLSNNQANLSKCPSLSDQRDKFLKIRDKLTAHRDKLYQTNYLDSAYRGFIPTATMYGYLVTGRCTVIYGHGGIIDTYVHDSQFQLLNRKLDVIIDNLSEIRNSQQELAKAIDQSMKEQRRMHSEILSATRQSASNSAAMLECQRYSNQCLTWIATLETYKYF